MLPLSLFAFILTNFLLSSDVLLPKLKQLKFDVMQNISKYPHPFLKSLLLIISGDIETNPGPINVPNHDLCVVHVNARSLKNKIDLIEAESHQYDIITISETWLERNDNCSLLITP